MGNKPLKYAVTGGGPLVHEAAPVLFKGDLYKNMDLAKEIGYDALELHIKNPAEIDGKRMKEYCDNLNFSISALVTGMSFTQDKLSLIDDSTEGRDRAITRLMECIDLAAQLDCIVIIGYMRGNIPEGNSVDKYKNYLIDSLSRLTDYAKEKNVVLALEVINRYEVNYLNSIEETIELIDEIDCEFLKVHIDTFHMNIEEKDFEESIRFCRNKLAYVHYSDSNRKAPGMGHIDFVQVTKLLKEINYDGYVSLECLYDKDPYETAEKALMLLKAIEANIE